MTDEPTVPERLLDAAVVVAAVHGISRLSVGDVAKHAKLSRQTLYKHFATRDELISRAVLREAGLMVEQVITAASAFDDPAERLEHAILEALRLVRGHPLLDRLIETEPEALLPLLIDGNGSVLGAVTDIAHRMIEDGMADVSEAGARAGADLMSRMLISYAIRPPEAPPAETAHSLCTAVLAAVTAASATATSTTARPRD